MIVFYHIRRVIDFSGSWIWRDESLSFWHRCRVSALDSVNEVKLIKCKEKIPDIDQRDPFSKICSCLKSLFLFW